MHHQIEILLLLALPASGKSELRRYLEHLDPDVLARDMRLGPTVQLDDYPYVHLMRRISQELRYMGEEPVFFASDEGGWSEPLDWLTLIELVNDDYRSASSGGADTPTSSEVLDRISAARAAVGAPDPFGSLEPAGRRSLADAIANDVAELDPIPPLEPSNTVIIEFARGGPTGGQSPLPHPLGYAASLATLDDSILERASILYVWVDPDESRQRNRERARPGRAGDASILHHGVPESVMENDYGVDDMEWLLSQGRVAESIAIRDHDVRVERFDNRRDRTSFLRGDPDEWPTEAVEGLHADLAESFGRLATPH